MGSVAAQDREQARLAVLRATGLLDSAPEREFEALVDLARDLTGCKRAAISLIDADRQWFKAKRGLSVSQTPRDEALCAIVVAQDEALIVPDASLHPRFRSYPPVVGPPHIRFYAGIPLRARERADQPEVPLGTLCVIDDKPRKPSDGEMDALRRLALLAEEIIRARFAALRAANLMVRHQRDLVEITRAHRQLVQSERLVEIGSWRLNMADQRIEWSDGVFAIHGLPPGKPPALENALDFYPPQSREVISAAVERAMADGTPFDIELDFLPVSGESRRVRTLCECEYVDGRPSALIGVFQDVTERRRTEEALRRSATVDELTGLTNRAGFNAALETRIAQAREVGEPLALALIDLDGFKAVNDHCGHLAGDEVLQTIAARLARRRWSGCGAARLGGDEFVLLLDHPPGSTAFHAAVETLLADLRLQVPHEDCPLSVSGTIGISWFDGASTRRDLLNRADQALYAAKRDRPGTARVFGSDAALG